MKINPLYAALAALGLGATAVALKRKGSFNVINPTMFKKTVLPTHRDQAATLVAQIWLNTAPPQNWFNANADSPQIRALILQIDPNAGFEATGVITVNELAGFLGLKPGTFKNMVQSRHQYSAQSQKPLVVKQQIPKTRKFTNPLPQQKPPMGTYPITTTGS